jgi:PST family polysaccharide transporter
MKATINTFKEPYYHKVVFFTLVEKCMNGKNDQKLSEIFSGVICTKSIVYFSSLLILTLTLLVFFIDVLKGCGALCYATFGLVLGNVLFPSRFFQGVEQIKFITMNHVAAKVLFTILIFALIQEKTDTIYVPLLNSHSASIEGKRCTPNHI